MSTSDPNTQDWGADVSIQELTVDQVAQMDAYEVAGTAASDLAAAEVGPAPVPVEPIPIVPIQRKVSGRYRSCRRTPGNLLSKAVKRIIRWF